MRGPFMTLVGLLKVGDVEERLLMHIKQSHMPYILWCLFNNVYLLQIETTMTHCLSQLWPIHCHHNSIVWVWRRLKIPVGHLVKHRGHLYSPVLDENYSM